MINQFYQDEVMPSVLGENYGMPIDKISMFLPRMQFLKDGWTVRFNGLSRYKSGNQLVNLFQEHNVSIVDINREDIDYHTISFDIMMNSRDDLLALVDAMYAYDVRAYNAWKMQKKALKKEIADYVCWLDGLYDSGRNIFDENSLYQTSKDDFLKSVDSLKSKANELLKMYSLYNQPPLGYKKRLLAKILKLKA